MNKLMCTIILTLSQQTVAGHSTRLWAGPAPKEMLLPPGSRHHWLARLCAW